MKVENLNGYILQDCKLYDILEMANLWRQKDPWFQQDQSTEDPVSEITALNTTVLETWHCTVLNPIDHCMGSKP